MQNAIKPGKMAKIYRRHDDVYYSPQRYLFSGALWNLLSANQFRRRQYLPRFARTIIPLNYVLWSGRRFVCVEGRVKERAEVYRSFNRVLVIYRWLIKSRATISSGYFWWSVRSCFMRKHWSAFTRIRDPSAAEISPPTRRMYHACAFNVSPLWTRRIYEAALSFGFPEQSSTFSFIKFARFVVCTIGGLYVFLIDSDFLFKWVNRLGGMVER